MTPNRLIGNGGVFEASGGGVVGVHGDAPLLVRHRAVGLPVVDEKTVLRYEAFDYLQREA